MNDTSVSVHDFQEVLLFLVTAAVVVPTFRKLRVSPVIGFLLAGVVLGPSVLGHLQAAYPILDWVTFTNIPQIARLGEFGVVFLLFMIGLELSFDRLRRMRQLVFGLGASQVVVTGVVLAGLAWALGQTPAAAIVIGGALALSSTAVVMPVMAENRRLNAPAGRASFAILLFQDLAIAPLLFLVPILGHAGEGSVLGGLVTAIVPAALALVVLVGLGRLVLRPLFQLVASSGSTEFFMAACLLVVISTSLIAASSGLSMELGAFVAGLLLAETQYRREIEVTIEPFKGLLLGVFFVAVGAELDLNQIVQAPGLTVGVAIGLVAVKAGLLGALGRVFGLPGAVAREVALMLGPGGEFAFVLLAAAAAAGVVPAPLAAALAIAVTLSMMAIPGLAALAKVVVPQKVEVDPALAALVPPSEGPPRVLVIGYGRVGRLVGEMLARHDVPVLAVDGDAKLVSAERDAGNTAIYWGDATRPDFLDRCGLARARAMVITMDNTKAVDAVVAAARAAWPELTIVARARDAVHATRLYQRGVSDAVPETVEASLQLSEAVLADIGVPMGLVIASIHEKRDEFRALLQGATPGNAPTRGIRLSQRVRAKAMVTGEIVE